VTAARNLNTKGNISPRFPQSFVVK